MRTMHSEAAMLAEFEAISGAPNPSRTKDIINQLAVVC
jgi:hypothetical protein